MAREYIDDRNYRILHNRYDDHGNLIGQFYRYYKDNSTKTTIFLHPEVIMDNETGTGTRAADFSRSEKKVVLECEELGFVGDNCPELSGYHMNYNGDDVVCTFMVKNGADIVIKTYDGADTLEVVK